jgi:UDP-N-acetylglucosamine 2-epimerase (non-hydrolysing)
MYEGIDPDRVFFVGNTIVDSIRIFNDVAEKKILDEEQKILGSIEGDYLISTIHRVSNTENKKNLETIVNALNEIDELSIIFLLHPRTEKKLQEYELMDKFRGISNLKLSTSIDYLSMLKIMKNERCKLILTDSGGLQEEAATLKIPCLTLRPNTERPETVEQGINKLVKIEKEEIKRAVQEVLFDKNLQEKFANFIFPYGDGFASEKIVKTIENKWDKVQFRSPEMYEEVSRSFTLLKIETEIERTLIEGNLKGKITMVYDEKGNPIPIPERLERGYIVRVTRI